MWLWSTLAVATSLAAEPLLTAEQQRADFDELWAAMDEMHPSLHLYTAAARLDAIRADVRARLDAPRSSGDFWVLLMESVEPIGCGHTTVFPPDEALRDLMFGSRVFPLDLVVRGGALHVDARVHEDPGRIVSVQGVDGDEVLRRLRGLTNSDGRSAPFQDHTIDGYAPYFLPFLFGRPATYDVVVERDGATERRSATGPFEVAEGSDPGPSLDHERYEATALDPASGARLPATPKNLAGRVLLLTFDGFEGKLRRKVIKPLVRARDAGMLGVVMDLRRNGGGDPWPAFELFGHLIDADELVYDQKLFRWPYYAELITGGRGRAYAARTHPDVVAELDITDGLYDRGYGDRAHVRALDPTYEGPVVVLTSGNTFSTAADLAALLKRNGRGVVVGTPTGGSATLQTSGASTYLLLTHSGVKVSIPLNRSRLVDPGGRLSGSVGVAPDHVLEPALDDLRAGRDPALERAVELLAGDSAR